MEKHLFIMLSQDRTFGHATCKFGLFHGSLDYSLRVWTLRLGFEVAADVYFAVDFGIGPVRVELRLDRPFQ